MNKKTVLIICDGMPYPPNDGVRTRVFNIAKQLLPVVDVKIIAIVKDAKELAVLDEAQKALGDSIIPVQVKYGFFQKVVTVLRTVYERRPIEFHYYYFKNVANKIREVISNNKIDYVQYERSFLGFYDHLVPDEVEKVINLYDYETLRHRRLTEVMGWPLKLFTGYNQKRIAEYEEKILRSVDKVFAISKDEKASIKSELGITDESLDVLTGGVDTSAYPFIDKLPSGDNILFVGSHMNFNYDAIRYFYFEIFPKLREKNDKIKWYIVGKLDKEQLKYLLNDKAVEFCSFVPSVLPYYEKCRALVVPLRGGSGTRIKIFEAMALGRAIVSTSVGCEGIEVSDGENIIVADTQDEFASGVNRLIDDDGFNDMLRKNAADYIRSNFDWSEVVKPLIKYYIQAN